MGAGVPEALAGRFARLIAHHADEGEADAPARVRERAQADLASLREQLLELGRLAESAALIAAHLDESLCVELELESTSTTYSATTACGVARSRRPCADERYRSMREATSSSRRGSSGYARTG